MCLRPPHAKVNRFQTRPGGNGDTHRELACEGAGCRGRKATLLPAYLIVAQTLAAALQDVLGERERGRHTHTHTQIYTYTHVYANPHIQPHSLKEVEG